MSAKAIIAGVIITLTSLVTLSAYAQSYTNIASMISACPATSQHCVIDLKGRRAIITTTLRIDPLRVTVRDGIIDATNLAAGQPAILVTSDGDSLESYDTAVNSLDHLILIGNSNVDGIIFNNNDNDNIRAAALTINNVAISGFRRGVTFGNHAYGLGISHAQIHNNTVGVYTIPNPVDAGERIAFSDVGVFNNTTGIDDEGGMEMDWVGSRWDYNGMTAILGGLVSFDGHMEMQKSATPVIALHALVGQLPGALFITAGSFILVNGSGGQAGGSYWISSTSSGNIVQFPGSTYGVRGTVSTMQGPGAVYGPALPAYNPK